MMKPHLGSQETLEHECDPGRGRPPVLLHDVYSYLFIEGKHYPVKFCPYCGVCIEEDARCA